MAKLCEQTCKDHNERNGAVLRKTEKKYTTVYNYLNNTTL